MRRAFPPVVLLCALVASCAQPTGRLDRRVVSVDAAGHPEVGVQFHAMWSDYTDRDRIAVLDRLAAAHVGWVRIDMGWSSFLGGCPTCVDRGEVALADRAVDAARARGLRVLGMLWRTPAWANGGRGVHAPPSDPNTYAQAAAWIAAHFRGRVSAWEVWNEPNHEGFWEGDVSDYVRLLRAAYSAIKGADPGARVVLGGPMYNDLAWLEAAYAEGAAGSFDVMSTHPYQLPSDLPPEATDGSGPLLADIAAVRALMERNGDGDKEIWFTEFGWSAHADAAGDPEWLRGVTPQQQADFLVRTLDEVATRYPYVTAVFWYNERNRITGHPHLDNFGLMDRSLAPRPVYHALADRLGRMGFAIDVEGRRVEVPSLPATLERLRTEIATADAGTTVTVRRLPSAGWRVAVPSGSGGMFGGGLFVTDSHAPGSSGPLSMEAAVGQVARTFSSRPASGVAVAVTKA